MSICRIKIMTSNARPILVVLLATQLLASCARVAVSPESPRNGRQVVTAVPPVAQAPAEPPPVVEKPRESLPAEPPRVPPPPPAPPVLALLDEAEGSRQSGQLDAAAAALERAIRIQPRNALLWHRLAAVRLQQQQPGLAEDLAKKSLILAGGDAALTKQNWTLIAEARRLRGDTAGADEAASRATQ